jgi:hypothetical protein
MCSRVHYTGERERHYIRVLILLHVCPHATASVFAQVVTHATPTLASPTYLDRELENARATTQPLAAPSDATGAGMRSSAGEGAGAAGVDEIRGSRGRLSHEVSTMRGILRQFHKVERKADAAVDSVAAAAARERGGGRGRGAGGGGGAAAAAPVPNRPAADNTELETNRGSLGATDQTPLWIKWGV